MDSPRDVPTYDKKPEMSARARRPTRSSERWRERRLRLRDHQLREPGHGRPHRRDRGRGEGGRDRGRVPRPGRGGGAASPAASASITADHGNADHMLEPDGSPNTAHSMNPVPLIVTARRGRAARGRHPGRRGADGAGRCWAGAAGRDDREAAQADSWAWLRRLQDRRPRRRRPRGRPPTRRTATVRTPAFVPLASTATVKSLHASEVAELGYDMVLGNTFHLFIQPGHELIARDGRPARVHGLGAADHHRLGRLPGVLDGPRVGGRGDQAPPRQARSRWCISIEEEGVRFRSYLDGARALHGPGDLDGGAGRARLGHRARLRRVHALPRRARLHRALDGAHAPLARPLRRLARASTRPSGQLLYGIVQGGVYEDLRARVDRATWPARASTASRSAARSARRRSRCARWSGWSLARPARRARRGTCSASATWTTSSTRWARASTPSTAPRPRGWRATAPRSCTTRRAAGGSTSPRARHRDEPRADRRRLPVPGLPRAHARLPALPDPGRAS